jgi:metal-responsive CopG/Arc/MetJ family transcriptional regulator
MEKLIPLTVTVPAEVFAEIEQHARSQYLSRSAVVRRLIIEHLAQRKVAAEATESEVAA